MISEPELSRPAGGFQLLSFSFQLRVSEKSGGLSGPRVCRRPGQGEGIVESEDHQSKTKNSALQQPSRSASHITGVAPPPVFEPSFALLVEAGCSRVILNA